MGRLWDWPGAEIMMGLLGVVGIAVVCAGFYHGIETFLYEGPYSHGYTERYYKTDGYSESVILLLGGGLWLYAVWRSWPRD